MEWVSEALVLGARPHGETSVLLEVMTPDFGRHLGLVRGGRSRRMQPMLQPGNSILATWRARLETHLGLITAELDCARAARLMESAAGVYGMQVLAGHLRYLAEREPHPFLYRAALALLDHVDTPLQTAALIARFELMLLDELGFGLDLACCAATGSREELVYVSPRSARAVCRAAGLPYGAKLLPLPAFLLPADLAPPAGASPDQAAVLDGLRLTGYFLDRHVAGPRAQPLAAARAQLVEKLKGTRPPA